MALENLIHFIDLCTSQGAVSPIEVSGFWGEGLEDEGIELVGSLSSDDWSIFLEKITGKSDTWIECLIELIGGADTLDSRRMLIEIALTCSDENFLDAMEWIRDFEEYISSDIWQKLKKRSSKVLRKRLGFKTLS